MKLCVYVRKVGVSIRTGGELSAWEWGTIWNTWKGGEIEKRGGEKNFKKGQAGSSSGCFKKGGGGGTPFRQNKKAVYELV